MDLFSRELIRTNLLAVTYFYALSFTYACFVNSLYTAETCCH